MTDPRETLARIRAQADAATAGPWEADGSAHVLAAGSTPTFVARCADPDWSDAGVLDAEFIAAARTTVPALVDALEKVLELHSPLAGRPFWDAGIRCSGCYDSYYDVYEPYPCELVKAITTALEGETR